MTLRCKPGDLVILRRADAPCAIPFVGSVRTAIRQHPEVPNFWELDPSPVDSETGYRIVWADKDLTPIRGLPETETTQEQQPCTA